MNSQCRECGCWRELDAEKRCDVCAPRTTSPAQQAAGVIIYHNVIKSGFAVDFPIMNGGAEMARLIFQNKTGYFTGMIGKTYRVTVEEIE